jgi:hypothetical protein
VCACVKVNSSVVALTISNITDITDNDNLSIVNLSGGNNATLIDNKTSLSITIAITLFFFSSACFGYFDLCLGLSYPIGGIEADSNIKKTNIELEILVQSKREQVWLFDNFWQLVHSLTLRLAHYFEH